MCGQRFTCQICLAVAYVMAIASENKYLFNDLWWEMVDKTLIFNDFDLFGNKFSLFTSKTKNNPFWIIII